MERKVIRIKARNGNGLIRCDYCGVLTWDCITYDCFRYDTVNYDTNAVKEFRLKPICSQCLDDVKTYWLKRGYIVKEPSING